MADDRVIDWLLAGDAAIRWQTLRDLVGASECAWKREQRKVGSEGWGARLLALQDADKVFFEVEETGQPSRWNTLRALRVLRWAGLA